MFLDEFVELNCWFKQNYNVHTFLPRGYYHQWSWPIGNLHTTLLGVVKSKRSIWRLKTITDFFWAIVNLIGVFFATMFSVIKRVSLYLDHLRKYQINLSTKNLCCQYFHGLDGKVGCLQKRISFWKEMGWWWPRRPWRGTIWWSSTWATSWTRQCSRNWP